MSVYEVVYRRNRLWRWRWYCAEQERPDFVIAFGKALSRKRAERDGQRAAVAHACGRYPDQPVGILIRPG